MITKRTVILYEDKMIGGNNMLPKVSVVVPVYKVEGYLDRCVESILNQTYSNLEVILVDDESPDHCGEMVDHYAETDGRVKAFHKANGGLSDARNYGMQYVNGEYTLFVDSDDWLDRNMIEEMVGNSIDFKADVVQTAFYYAYDDYLLFDDQYFSKNDAPTVLDKQSLMLELVKNEKVKNFAWGKLYRTKIIKDIPFEKGVLFEDVFWAHQVMHRVNTYVMLHQPMVYYYQRDDSIVGTYSTKNLDILKGLMERHQFIERYYPQLVNESYKVILKTSLIHYQLLSRNRQIDKEGVNRKGIQNYIKAHYPSLKKAVEMDSELRRQLRLFTIHPSFNVFFLIVNKILQRLRIRQQPIKLERLNLKNQIR